MSVSIQTFAERVLFGTSIEDKCFFPEKVRYDVPRTVVRVPDEPSRPKCLEFSDERLPFPKHFSDPESRATALHFFANHELLAIELMALCLLRFPDAPTQFQKGLVHIISEEQEHLQLYLHRLQELGGEVGQVPVNGFFWDCLSGMNDPMDFVVGMSMTFEQANLDHCIHYGRLFQTVGDQDTVDILDKVYQDEVRHLRHGLHWFRKWKPPNEADFFSQEKSLQLPMSMMRAKGSSFDGEGRRKAGFDTEYINQLEVYSLSKGRPSDVYVFTPNCELDHAGQQPKKIAQLMALALAPLMMVLCKKDDIVLSEPLPQQTLLNLKRVGFPLPQQLQDLDDIGERKLGQIRPWGLSRNIAERYDLEWRDAWSEIFGKSWGAECLRRLQQQFPEDFWTDVNSVGKRCHTLDEVLIHIQYLNTVGYEKYIAKINFSTAGRGAKRFSELPEVESWLERVLSHQAVVVEPCFDRVIDCSIQMDVRDESTKVLAMGRFETDSQGQYLGHHFGAVHSGLSKELLRFVHGDGKDSQRMRRLSRQVAEVVGSALRDVGFSGPVGVDAMIVRTAEGFKIRPIVEVNPRYTMGRIAHELSRFVHPKSTGMFKIVRTKQFLTEFPIANMQIEDRKWRMGFQILTNPDYPVMGIIEVNDAK